MASRENDLLQERTTDGTVNLYDGGKSRGTATDKGMAARMGGHTWNPINGDSRTEIYFNGLRNESHPFFLGTQRAKFPTDPRMMVKTCLRAPDSHPRHSAMRQRRTEVQLAQTENSFSYAGFQNRCGQLFPANPPKRYSIENSRFCFETEKLRPKQATRQEWAQRRAEQMTTSVSCPSLDLRNPAGSLDRAMREDPRKHASQLQTESDHQVPRVHPRSVAMSKDATGQGRAAAQSQSHLSVHRVENADFSVTRKNGHYSGHDFITKDDPYYARPQNARISNSVKYDIINNQRKWFKY
mmetsp:Transcript_82247/g.222845  ORF Transcript_82247/g.222845 Transcript_82247/m.222845 type:complete len:297 (-) Transcript_82247:143-1033(-)